MTDTEDCEECGESEGHDPDCSEYVAVGNDDPEEFNMHDEPNGYDDVTREDFARDEWRR